MSAGDEIVISIILFFDVVLTAALGRAMAIYARRKEAALDFVVVDARICPKCAGPLRPLPGKDGYLICAFCNERHHNHRYCVAAAAKEAES